MSFHVTLQKNRSNSEIIKRSFVDFNVARRRQSNLLSALGFTWKLNDAQRSTFLENCIAQYKTLLIAICDTVQEDARVFDEGVKALGLTVKTLHRDRIFKHQQQEAREEQRGSRYSASSTIHNSETSLKI